jgi:hypothetical protein
MVWSIYKREEPEKKTKKKIVFSELFGKLYFFFVLARF